MARPLTHNWEGGLLKYGHITLKFVGRYFHWVVIIFSQKYGYFSQQIGKRRKKRQNPFPAILWLKQGKDPTDIELGGGGGGGKG